MILEESKSVENEKEMEVIVWNILFDWKLIRSKDPFKRFSCQAFLLKHGENMVDCLGAEVDRIEKNLKQKHPEVFWQR